MKTRHAASLPDFQGRKVDEAYFSGYGQSPQYRRFGIDLCCLWRRWVKLYHFYDDQFEHCCHRFSLNRAGGAERDAALYGERYRYVEHIGDMERGESHDGKHQRLRALHRAGNCPGSVQCHYYRYSVADTTKTGTGIADIHVHHDTQDLQSAPVKLGTSGGNKNDTTQNGTKLFCCSGTLGSLVSRGGNFFILSNNHVLDRSDQGTIGDPVSQPGLVDTQCGRTTNNIVANLSQAAPLKTSNVDAALAQIVTGEVDLSGTVLDLAAPGQPAAPSSTLATATIGQGVAKSGEATGLTCASVSAINVTVNVNYSTSCQGGTTFPVTFTNQIALGDGTFSNSGDSGSLVVTSDNARPVALMYAGSSTATVASPIQSVLSALSDTNGVAPTMVGGPDHAVSCPATNQSAVAAREKRGVATTLPDSEITRASSVKNRRTIELMQDPAVSGVGVGQSDDNPAESAIVVFVNGQPRNPIPAQLDGVRTKVIAGSAFLPQTAGTQQASALPGISQTEIVRARTVKEQHAQDLMSNSAILGVGVGASNDNPTEGALVIFVDKSSSAAVPAEIDGVRTRVIVSDPFRSYNWGTRTVKACSRLPH